MLDIKKIRADFPILSRKVRGKDLVYLDNAATTQKPRQVIEALSGFYERSNANVHRGVHALSEESTALMEGARAAAARFIRAKKPETVIFTRNTTESINLVAHAWGRKNVKAGDEILLTEMEHHSNIVPWQMLAKASGAALRFVPLQKDGTIRTEDVRKSLSERTRLFSFTAMSNALGTINPVAEWTALARSAGALALVDGAQWVPHMETDVAALGCDFLAFSAHKMLGPTGLGVLYGREALLEAMDPFLGGGDMINEVRLDGFTSNILPYKFEAGTPNFADAAAFHVAIDYLDKVGFESVRLHEESLLSRALEIAREEGLAVYGPEELRRRGGVVSFNLADLHPHDVGQVFDMEGVAIRSGHHCCQPLMRSLGLGGTARASFYLYNTLDDVEAFGRALRRAKAFFKVGAKSSVGA